MISAFWIKEYSKHLAIVNHKSFGQYTILGFKVHKIHNWIINKKVPNLYISDQTYPKYHTTVTYNILNYNFKTINMSIFFSNSYWIEKNNSLLWKLFPIDSIRSLKNGKIIVKSEDFFFADMLHKHEIWWSKYFWKRIRLDNVSLQYIKFCPR